MTIATFVLIAGIVTSDVEAATVTPTMIGARFSSNVGWTPNAPADGDTIGTSPANRTIIADVTGRQIAFFVQSSPITVTAPVYVQNPFQVTSGMPTPVTPVQMGFLVDAQTVDLFTSALNPQNYYTRFFFDVENFGGGNTIVAPNAVVTFNGDNINAAYMSAELSGGAVAGGAGIADFVGTPGGTNIVFTGTINNLLNIYVRANNFASFSQNVTLGNDLTIYNNASFQLQSGINLTAGSMNSDSTSSATHLIMAGNNIVDAQIGQGSDIPIADAQLLSGTGQFAQSVNFTGDITLSAGTRLRPEINLTAASIVPLSTDCDLYVNAVTESSIIDTNIGGSGNPLLRDIILEDGSSIVEFKQDVNFSRNFGLGPNVTAKFDGNVTGPQLTTAFVDTTVEFANSAPVQIDVSIANPANTSNPIEIMEFSGTDVTFLQTFFAGNINFSNPAASAIVTLAPTQDLGATNVTTASTGRIHNIHVGSDQNITGNIASFSNPLGIIRILNDSNISVNTGTFYTDVYPLTNGAGSVEFALGGAFSYTLGTRYTLLNAIIFSANAEVRGSAHASVITVAPGKTASFVSREAVAGYTVIPFMKTTNGFILEGAGSTAIFGDLTEVRGNIIANIAGQGNVLFTGNANMRATIGSAAARLNNVTFAANSFDQNIFYTRDIYANTINFSSATINIAAGGTITGSTTLDSPTVNIGQHIWIFTGGNSQFVGNPVFNVYFDNHSNSHITVTGQTGVMNLADVESLTFNVDDASSLPFNFTRTYNFYRIEDGGSIIFTDNSKVIVNNNRNNIFVNWSYKTGQLIQAFNLKGGLSLIIAAAGGNTSAEFIDSAAALFSNFSNSTSIDFLNYLAAEAAQGFPEVAGEAVIRLAQAANPTSEVVINTINNYQSGIVNTRVNNITNVSAGDKFLHEYGIWVEPFYNKSVQKIRGFAPGYDAKAVGGSVGVDVKLSEDLMLGIAGTIINNKMSYKDVKIGDKSTIDTILLSLYGRYEINNDWFSTGMVSIGNNKVKNSKPRLSQAGNQIAYSKYNTNSYGAEIACGYNYQIMPGALLTPILGAKYSRFGANKYQETGSSMNINMSKKSYNKLEAIFGGNLIIPQQFGAYNLLPEIHGFVNCDLINKAPQTLVNIEGLGTTFEPFANQKPQRAIYNIGGSLGANTKSIEYQLGYDLRLAKKFTSHQVALKLRVRL
jgi:outer membrane autotransporter protein